MSSNTESDLPRPHPEPWPLVASAHWLEAAEKRMPGTTSSMMKRPEQFCPGSFPGFLAQGKGALVEDVDGNQYIDFICGLGASSLGHRHPAVESAVLRAVEAGWLHSLPTPLEQEAAEAVIASVPGAEMVRFFKTGADATSAAVRLARAITGREKILTVGYNGWHDHFMYDTPGVPKAVAELSQRLPLFTEPEEAQALATLEAQGSELAAIVLSLPYNRRVTAQFLNELCALTRKHGALLVFDEIVTGYRLGAGGAQELYGVQADLVCVSKALAAGLPLSAILGSKALLEQMERLQVSTTFGGETLSLAACVAALEVYRTTSYYEHIATLGRNLREGVGRVAEEVGAPLRVLGYDPIPLFAFSPKLELHIPLMRTLQGHMARRGVLLRRDVNFISGVHTQTQIDFTVNAVRSSLIEMRLAGAFSQS